MSISRSPDRHHTWQLDPFEEDPSTIFEPGDLEVERDEEWKKSSMEYALLTTEWILEKVRNSDSYAQNLYAAMCNTTASERMRSSLFLKKKNGAVHGDIQGP